MIRTVLAILWLATTLGCASAAPRPPAVKPPCGVAEPSRVPQIGAKMGRGGCEIVRDRFGKIKRSTTVRREFARITGYPYPKGRPGYRIDHIVALKRGGCDCLLNLQWLSDAEKDSKDLVE